MDKEEAALEKGASDRVCAVISPDSFVSVSETEPHPTDVEDGHGDHTPSPDELLYLRTRNLLTGYSDRQSEILRLAKYLHDRSAEIDNAKDRAKQLVLAKIDEADEQTFENFWDLYEAVRTADLGALSDDERNQAITSALRDIAANVPQGSFSTFMAEVARVQSTPAGVGVLHSSLLVMLVGELETLIKDLARTLIERHPESLGQSRTFTWKEISECDSVDEIRDRAVDKEIEDVLRGSLIEWCEFFTHRFKISVPNIVSTYPAQEIVQRRHVIVHNSGRVSRLYLEKLGNFNHDAELDDELTVDYAYLRRSADILYLIGYGLVFASCMRICGDDTWKQRMLIVLSDRTFRLLQEERYETIEMMVDNLDMGRLGEMTALVFQVNRWLALKAVGRFDECRSEVEGLDVSYRSNDFKLAKLALLGNVQDAHELATKMLRDGELRPEFWVTWPLLHDVREFERASSGGLHLPGEPLESSQEDD